MDYGSSTSSIGETCPLLEDKETPLYEIQSELPASMEKMG
jgi:hypothetical protein